MLKRAWLVLIVVFGVSVLPSKLIGQIVVEDVDKWTEKECVWLYRQALVECENQETCTRSPDFSMSTSRGLSSLENVLTVRIQQEFYEICYQTCQAKKRTSYPAFRNRFCEKVSRSPEAVDARAGRFIEFPGNTDTRSYDLSTVKMIQPGRFTIIVTTIDNPDVMRFKLKVYDTLETYCTRPEGKYDAPTELFILGQPDMAVEKINVESRITEIAGRKYSIRDAIWNLPYKRLAFHFSDGSLKPDMEDFRCEGLRAQDAEKESRGLRSFITNGSRTKWLFDCKRGLIGFSMNENDDPAKVITGFVRPDTLVYRGYLAVCQRVTREPPYVPK